MKYLLVLLALVLSHTSLYSQQIDTKALKAQIAGYGSCQEACAQDLAADLLNATPDAALKIVAYLKAAPKTSTKLQLLSFVVLAKGMLETGKTIVKDNVACYRTCDELNTAIVTLGRSGALGAMKRGEQISPSILDDPAVLDAYSKFVKPLKLPAEQRSKEWEKYISSLS
jgi:hypothetical protein